VTRPPRGNRNAACRSAGAAPRGMTGARPPCEYPRMRDYWLSKLFFDVQARGAEYRADREKFLAPYPLAPEVKRALAADDVGFLAQRVNPYLLRFYFAAAGMRDEEFIRRLRAAGAAERRESAHG
jgi:hypothetical protein